VRRRRGFALLVLAATIIPIFACVGLAIDTSILYVLKSKLSAAVDAGSLAGARALSRGINDTAQRTRAQEVATSYVRANFVSGYMMSAGLTIDQPQVDISISNQRSVTVTASVRSPTFFMRVLTGSQPLIRAAATAIRRDVNIMLVLDRSKSMNDSGSCDDMRSAASGFVSKFAPGRDNVGLETFATSTVVEFPIGDDFATASTTLNTRISRISCASGGTSSADALSRAYWELAGLNQPASLNAIVFFTDGQPTAVNANIPITAGGPCPASARPTLPGVWTLGGTPWGILNSQNGLSPIADDNRATPNSAGCGFTPTDFTDTSDYTYIPNTDVWGNGLDTGFMTGISRSSIAGGSRIRKDVAANVVPAATNAADDAGRRIRVGAAMNGRALPNVVIFGIGLGNASSPASHTFMLRVTNDSQSPLYTPDQREGLYVFAPSAADLHDAFTRLASEILRLSQ
jgi:Flp pilus assembly protein TadG